MKVEEKTEGESGSCWKNKAKVINNILSRYLVQQQRIKGVSTYQHSLLRPRLIVYIKKILISNVEIFKICQGKMLTKEKLINITKILFQILIFLIPLNLGKHFITTDSYVWGTLVDYLIPTLYVQDILVGVLLLTWFFSGFLSRAKILNLFSRREIQFSTLFVFSCLFSVISSQRVIPSIYFWFRMFLYFLLSIYIISEISLEKYFFRLLNLVSLSVLLLSLLGIGQFIKQGSVFNNYLFFGEQPYSFSTWGVAIENVFGNKVIPSYGTFRHPNIFGGFLSIFLLWILPYLRKSRKYLVSFLVGSLVLLFTFSVSAWVSFGAGIFIYLVLSINSTKVLVSKLKLTLLTAFFCVAMLVAPLLLSFQKSPNPSFFRRSDLLVSSYRVFAKSPLFGVGLNNFTILVDLHVPNSSDLRFTQPVHNVFALLLTETGVFSFSLFLILLYLAFRKLINPSFFNILFISFIQMLLLSSVDHYLFTINQTFLVFWLIFGLTFSEAH